MLLKDDIWKDYLIIYLLCPIKSISKDIHQVVINSMHFVSYTLQLIIVIFLPYILLN